MNLSQTFAISAAGMQVERLRVETAALNLANANTVQAPGQPAYQPLRVVASAAQTLQSASFLPVTPGALFAGLIEGGLQQAPRIADALPVPHVVFAGVKPRLAYEPGHPMANAAGWVSYAGVDMATEMMTLMTSTRAYEANVAAMNAAKALALKTLDIGGPGA